MKKKHSKKSKAPSRHPAAKKSSSQPEQKLETLRRELAEALEQQTATSEILRVIASSPNNLQPVLDVVAENAARLCDANDSHIRLIDGTVLRLVASCGPISLPEEYVAINRDRPAGRAVIDRQTIHIRDLQAVRGKEYPDSVGVVRGVRTVLAAPLMREGVPIGVILIRRTEVRPFTESQIALLKTFADQAVIAIENVRLFQGLTEALEQQTATSEVLKVISRSAFDLQPVFEAIVRSAAQLCEATFAVMHRFDGQLVTFEAHYGLTEPEVEAARRRFPRPADRETAVGRAILDRQIAHIQDIRDDPEYRWRSHGDQMEFRRTVLAVPLLREGKPIGAMGLWRRDVQPFSEKQIKLIETFADQAVIAIENVRLFQELTEALERQTATSEILGVIASSPTDLQPVLDVVAENAARLCDSPDALIYRVEGDMVRKVASYGTVPDLVPVGEARRISRGSNSGRAIVDRQTIHIHDMLAEREEDYPDVWPAVQREGIRTALAVPLLREGVPVGAITIRRTEVRPFTEKQIALLKTFADQAVIAIENVRLFQELTEALEQQIATSEILGVIASSPTDIQPVLNTVATNAARLCEATDAQIRLVEGDGTRLVASFGALPAPEFMPTSPRNPSGRAILTRETVHIHDLQDAVKTEFPESVGARVGVRTFLCAPMLREGTPIGVISIRRTEVRPFSDRHIKLLETFADQAVIAIENVRLFQELQVRNRDLTEALEQQTATSEILRVIASSPTDIQPVFNAILASASRLCETDLAALWRHNGEVLISAAYYNASPEFVDFFNKTPLRPGPEGPARKAALERRTVHVADMLTEPGFSPVIFQIEQARTVLAVPLLREDVLVGVIAMWRREVRPFTEQQIALVRTFADQAVIAIENVRLFKELQERNRDLTEALEQQTATSEILRVIASSPTDLQPVLDVLAENAARLCEAKDAVIWRIDGDMLQRVAVYGPMPVADMRRPITRGTPPGRAIIDRQTTHVHDMAAELDTEFPDTKVIQQVAGTRTIVATPLLREGIPIGAITVRRTEVRPFSDKQIALLKTFADQAVIAIENVRLFQELSEALEQQTATSEILGVIASSPTDIQPVLDAVAESAARLCDAADAIVGRVEGDLGRIVASYGSIPVPRAIVEASPMTRGTPAGRAVLDRETIHVHDLVAEIDTEYPEAKTRQQFAGTRTILATPLLREGIAIGNIVIRRTEVRPFSEKQIALLKTFADQAVIAIENVRLFNELNARNRQLTEALEQQTATSEILRVISSSPTDVQPVFDAIANSAARLCEALDAMVLRVDGDVLRLVAHEGSMPAGDVPLHRGTLGGRTVIERRVFHIDDLQAEGGEFPEGSAIARQRGHRTTLSVPLLREGTAIGNIQVRRNEVRLFTDKQIALLQTFADQAVIAIENVRLFQELTESLEQQTATSEILGVIARSPTDIQPVLDTVAESAARLCEAPLVLIFRVEGSNLRRVAKYGTIPSGPVGEVRPLDRGSVAARAVLDRETIHVHDLGAAEQGEFTVSINFQKQFGLQTRLATPLLREGVAIGAIFIRRTEVRPFTDKQIALLKTFADQAVIAIENVRLFQELTEALEQQTATSQILGVIASSPTDIQPVLDAVAESAARLCDAPSAVIHRVDGDVMRRVAASGEIPSGLLGEVVEIDRNRATGRAIVDRQTIHVHDMAVEAGIEFPNSIQQLTGTRTALATPLLREGVPIGVILVRRMEVRPFSDKQISLLKTFADQAVIAIENVRLFQELQARNRDLTEALEQQTATSEILRVISSSPTDLQPVFQTILANAVRLCEAQNGAVFRFDGEVFRAVVSNNVSPALQAYIENTPIRPGRESALRRVGLEKRPVHIPDMLADPECVVPEPYREEGMRTNLAVPLLRENDLIGAIAIHRNEVRPFTDAHIKLVSTFADQAVIAIENVRLFQELTESLERQTATSEILGVIASSPTDIQPVLDTVAESAARLCGANDALIYRVDGDIHQPVAVYGPMPVVDTWRPTTRGTPTGRAIITRQAIHVHDLAAELETEFPDSKTRAQLTGIRTILSAPLLREGIAIGAIAVRRTVVDPFTDKQIALLKTFADQAVIAIENVRLFQELTESLEQQTATSEILGVIASSPTDIQPVLNTVAANAARLCEAIDAQIRLVEGDGTRLVASLGTFPAPEFLPTSMKNPSGRAILQKRTIHVEDLAEASKTEYPESAPSQERTGTRTFLSTPMLREGTPIGLINIRRAEVRPFSERQIKLLETFADQAVIAIENVRLFQELEARTRELARSVGELKALGEVGQAVSSTLDLQTVLSTIVGHAVQLSGTNSGVIYEYDEASQEFHLRASHRMEEELVEAIRAAPIRLGEGATGRATTSRAPVQVIDLLDEREIAGTRVRPIMARLGYRSLLAVPLLREERIVGALTVWRKEAGSFSPQVVNLLQTFATQSALAIENARLFREIEDKGRQIEAANRHKSEFLANVSHELRTPLNAIIGFSEVLGERMFGELNEKQAEYTEDILSSGRHLLSLINDILDLAKIEAGRMELELTKFDLPSAVENALILVRERTTRHGIKLEREIDERLGDFVGDERKVKQILLNLLSNAVKFTPEGGQIRVKATRGDDSAIISVVDTGIGIALEDQEAIFEEFRQVGSDYTRKREGTGLGLSLTKKFVEMHGGKLWVESEIGKGATFTFTLPIRQG